MKQKTWREGPSLNTKRVHHACFIDKENENIYVIGGENENNIGLSSTEILNMNGDKWIFGKDLPAPIYGSQAVQARSTFYAGYLVGGIDWSKDGYVSHIIALRKSDQTWLKTSKSLQTARYGVSAVNVLLEDISGCYPGQYL